MRCVAPPILLVAVAVPMCACAVATALSHSHTVGVGESGHELGNGSYDSLTKQRALRASRTSEPSPGAPGPRAGLSRVRRPMSARCVLQFALAHLCVQKRGSVPASPARRSARERALRTLAPAALWRPAALGHLSASLQPRPARAPQPVLRVRPAAAIPVTPTASLCAPLWRQSSAPSRYLCALGAFSLHVAVARAYRTYVRLWQVANRSRLLPRCGCG